MDKSLEKELKEIEDEQLKKYKYNCSKRYKIKRLIYFLKREKFLNVISRYIKNFILRSKLKKNEVINQVNNPKFNLVLDKKIVVYSCIVGNYDMLNEPTYIFPNVEYILFTDQDFKSNIWKVKKIPKKILKLKNNVMISRYIKMHPHELFKNSDFEYAIYIDGYVKIITELTCFIRHINKKTGLAMFRHHSRNCVYTEGIACNLYKVGIKDKIEKQLEGYELEGYPKNNGMIECGVFAIDLKSEKSRYILLKWWEEFNKTKSMRDQLSLPYILWKNNIKIDDIGYLGNNIRWCPKFEIISHKK